MDENQNNQGNPVINKDTSEAVVSVRSITAKKQTRNSEGRFIKEGETSIPPISITTSQDQRVKTGDVPDLVNVKVTNPLVYIKAWWKRIMANEGFELKLKAKPITAIAISVALFSLVFGLGGVVFPFAFPWLKINNQIVYSSPTPVPEILKDTALKGTLTKTNTTPVKFYLITTSTEAVTLEVPYGFNLDTLVGKRILAVGTYDSKNKVLEVEDIQDLEVLSTTPVPIPTSIPTPKPTETPTPTVVPTATPTVEPTAISSEVPSL